MSDPTTDSSHQWVGWAKVLLAWLASSWGSFSLQGVLQILVLVLTAVFTGQQIYLNWRDKMRGKK